MNPLDSRPGLRRKAYALQWTANLFLGLLATVYTAQGESPEWLLVATGATNFLWAYLGLTAKRNTPHDEGV